MKGSLKGQRASIALSVVFLAAVGLAGWIVDAPLFLRIRGMAAASASASGDVPGVNVDDLNELNKYPPNRLAKFVSYPSATARAVVCMALSNRRSPGDPDTWAGVLPTLLNSYRRTEGRERRPVVTALWYLPHVLPTDAESVFGFVDDQLADKDRTWMLCAQLLETTARSCPDLQPRVLQAFERSMKLPVRMVREETLRRLATIAPKSLEAAKAVRLVATSVDTKTLHWDGSLPSPVFTILRRQPALLDEFLKGNRVERLIALATANRELSGSQNHNNDSIPRSAWLPPDRLDRMNEEARSIVTNAPEGGNELDDVAAFSLLGRTAGNEEFLFEAARKSGPKRRRQLLVPLIGSAKLSGDERAERFVEGRLSELLAWLQIDELRPGVAAVVLPSLRNPDWLKRLRAGPDGPIVDACRRLIDQRVEEYESSCLRVFADYGPELDPRDVDRLAALFEGKFDQAEKQFKKEVPYSGISLNAVERQILDRLVNYESRSNVQRLIERRRELQQSGAIQNAIFDQ
jgi:hypothetical protein